MERRDVVVRLADGPCAGTHAAVASFGHECWQRLDKSAGVFLRYIKNLYEPGEYVWSGDAMTEPELIDKLRHDRIGGETYAGSRAP